MNCPNCYAKMCDGDPCPECSHDDSDPDCNCDYCELDRLDDDSEFDSELDEDEEGI